jgi:hypothetical protein
MGQASHCTQPIGCSLSLLICDGLHVQHQKAMAVAPLCNRLVQCMWLCEQVVTAGHQSPLFWYILAAYAQIMLKNKLPMP